MGEPVPVTLVNVSHGEVADQGDNWHVVRLKTFSDGSVEEGCHIISKEALEWRSAEYDIPPEDLNTLLDVVLMEPYLTPTEWAVGPSLHDAATVVEAREAHLARVVSAKLRLRVSTQSRAAEKVFAIIPSESVAKKNEIITFLDIIRAGSPMDEETLKDKRRMVREHRKAVMNQTLLPKLTRRERFRKEADKRKESDRG